MNTKLFFTSFCLLLGQLFLAQMDDRFYQPSKAMRPFEMKISESLQFPVEQDTITAFISKPETKKIAKTILFFHGAAGNVTTYQYITKPLVEAGYQVVMIDFRGYGNSTGKPTHINVASDGQKLFDELLKRDDIKNTKIYIYGASLGSQIATHLAKDNLKKVSGLIIDGGMSSFADIAAKFAPQYKDFIQQMLSGVYKAKEDIKATEGLPKLFIYSKNDQTIPFEQGQEMYNNAASPKQFLEYSTDHLEAMKTNTDEVLKAIEKL